LFEAPPIWQASRLALLIDPTGWPICCGPIWHASPIRSCAADHAPVMLSRRDML